MIAVDLGAWAWTIDGGNSSCIVSSKVNPERDAQELGIIGYDHDRQYVLSPDEYTRPCQV